MGYWKSKVLPKIKKVFGPKKPVAKTEPEAPKEEVKVVEEKKEIEKVEEEKKEVEKVEEEEKRVEKVEEVKETPPPPPPPPATDEQPKAGEPPKLHE